MRKEGGEAEWSDVKSAVMKFSTSTGVFAGSTGGCDVKVLVACEESQTVTKELRRLGHEAYSCDIQECSGGYPEWHLRVDAVQLLKMRWDMIIAHPPCTYLSNASSVRLKKMVSSMKPVWKRR